MYKKIFFRLTKTFLLTASFLCLVLGLGLSSSVLAEEKKETIEIKMDVLVDLNIYQAKVISQERNKIKLSFDLANGKNVQTGVKYGVMLTKDTESGQFLVDEKVYDESLTLGENSTISKEIVYSAPDNLSGDYTVFINVKNESGFLFGVAYAGKINLLASSNGLVVLPETCFLTIAGSPESAKYNLTQGVDISEKENLVLNCKVENTSDEVIVATPYFETYYRSIYGKLVPQTGGSISEIKFNSKEKKDISVFLSKAMESQAYDVKFALKYNSDISNFISTHYVLRGTSATIQSVSLDKDYYKKNDLANITFTWSPSADSFPDSRAGVASILSEVTVSGTIINNKGEECSVPFEKVLSNDNAYIKMNLQAKMTQICKDPTIALSLKDKDGNVLDEKVFNVTSSPQKFLTKKVIAIGIAIIILIILYIIGYHKNNMNKLKDKFRLIKISSTSVIVLLGLVFSVGLLFPASQARAVLLTVPLTDDFSAGGGGADSGAPVTGSTSTGLNMSINLNKTNYTPGEAMIITTSAYYGACANTTRNLQITAEIVGYGNTHTIFNQNVSGQSTITSTYSNITVPTTPGSYILRVTANGYYLSGYIAFNYSTSQIVSQGIGDFSSFKTAINNYVYDNYPSDYSCFVENIGNVSTLQELQSAVNSCNIPLNFTTQGAGGLDFSWTYDFPFTVTAPSATVTVYVDDVKSVLKNAGESVSVTWDSSTNADHCICECQDPGSGTPINCGGLSSTSYCGGGNSTGQGVGPDIFSTPNPITNLLRPIKFKVTCYP